MSERAPEAVLGDFLRGATKTKALWMRCAFGEWASPGRNPSLPARATALKVSATAVVAMVARAVRRTPSGIV